VKTKTKKAITSLNDFCVFCLDDQCPYHDEGDPVTAVRWMIGQHLLWAAWWAFTLLCLGSLTALVAF
jgi:hypothetical protein